MYSSLKALCGPPFFAKGRSLAIHSFFPHPRRDDDKSLQRCLFFQPLRPPPTELHTRRVRATSERLLHLTGLLSPTTAQHQERFKLDMDEGPERTRLHLRPNRAFYDTYEVLAPAPSSSLADLAAQQQATPAEAAPPVLSASAAKAPAEDPSKLTSAPSAGTSPIPGDVGVSSGEAGMAVEAVTVAEPAAADPTAMVVVDSDQPKPPMAAPASTGGESVAAIAALVKTMNESVGVAGRGGPRKQPLTSVFDLDDTDCSALLELEELHLEDVSDGTEHVSGSRSTFVHTSVV